MWVLRDPRLSRPVLVSLLISVLGLSMVRPPAASAADPILELHVEGNHLVDSGGKTVRLRGVNVPSLEWSKSGVHLSQEQFDFIARDWRANAVRVPINQDWALSDQSYLAMLDQVVTWTRNSGLYLIIDLHWISGRQQALPNSGSVAMWQWLAARWSGETHILYDVFNEPRDTDWGTWKGWAGQLVDAVRQGNPDAVCVVGGVDWSYDLRSMASDPVNRPNIMLSAHDYPWKQLDREQAYGFLSDRYPILVGEWGGPDSKTEWAAALLDYINAKGLSYTAWAFYPGGNGFPSLIKDWTYDTTAVGAVVSADLRATAAAASPASSPGTNPGAMPAGENGLSGLFASFWQTNGGLPVFGLPVSAELEERNGNTGDMSSVQYVERQRLEYHSENAGTPYEVQLGRLGVEALQAQGQDWNSLPKASPDALHYFPQTGQAIADTFWQYWNSHGLELSDPGVSYRESVALFGYPISEPRMETNSSGDTVLTQWFERARFEWHPDAPGESKVMLGRLGAERLGK